MEKIIAISIPVYPSGFADIYGQGGKLLRYLGYNVYHTITGYWIRYW